MISGFAKYCAFDWMKKNAGKTAPLGGAETFINKDTNGRWQGVLTADDVAAYEARAGWLAGGQG